VGRLPYSPLDGSTQVGLSATRFWPSQESARSRWQSATSYQLPATSYQLPATSYQLSAVSCQPESAESRRTFPTDERFGLTAHLRKSAISVPSKIAQGCGRDTGKELARFLSIAAGCASELEYQLHLTHDFEHLPRDAHAARYDQVAEVTRTLYRFMQSLSAPGLTADR
jgi:four helix bundle protein